MHYVLYSVLHNTLMNTVSRVVNSYTKIIIPCVCRYSLLYCREINRLLNIYFVDFLFLIFDIPQLYIILYAEEISEIIAILTIN